MFSFQILYFWIEILVFILEEQVGNLPSTFRRSQLTKRLVYQIPWLETQEPLHQYIHCENLRNLIRKLLNRYDGLMNEEEVSTTYPTVMKVVRRVKGHGIHLPIKLIDSVKASAVDDALREPCDEKPSIDTWNKQ